MNHLITLALGTITLGACTSKLDLLKQQHIIQFEYRVMDEVSGKLYFTNAYENINGRLKFIDHEGALVDCQKCTLIENLTHDRGNSPTNK